MTQVVTVKEVIESGQKFGKNKVLSWHPDKYRDNKQQKKSSKYDCTWVPIMFKRVNGEQVSLNLKFSCVPIASSAKKPSSIEEDTMKNLVIAFRKFTNDELNSGDYAPKNMKTEEEQAKEVERANKYIKTLVDSANEFNDAIEIIDLSYKNIVEEIKSAKTLGYNIRKDKNVKDVKNIVVYSIRQVNRVDSEDPNQKEVLLKFPLTRIKLMLNKDGDVGYETWNRDTKSFHFAPNVYDVDKACNAKNLSKADMLPKVKTNGILENLNARNAGTFITYKSSVSGIIEFPEIIISKFGFSFANKFRELYVRHHKKNSTESLFSPQEFREMYANDDDIGNEKEYVESSETAAEVQNEDGEYSQASEIDDSDLE